MLPVGKHGMKYTIRKNSFHHSYQFLALVCQKLHITRNMKYAFTCPVAGCKHTMTVDAQNDAEALEKLSLEAKEHVAMIHPQLEKTDEQIRRDVKKGMVNMGAQAQS
jgi:hypothetical protein